MSAPRVTPTPLFTQAYRLAHHGSRLNAKEVFYAYAHHKRWSRETKRARWDGAVALLEWWHGLPKIQRPLLDNLNHKDGQAFIRYLEERGLARSTVKGYRSGARALVQATAWGVGNLERSSTLTYDPFRFASRTPVPPKQPMVDPAKLVLLAERVQVRIKVLLALMELGLSLPEVCDMYWSDVDVRKRYVVGYHKRLYTIHAHAAEVLSELWAILPRSLRSRDRRVLCWNPDTARRWLRQVCSGHTQP
jgi:hypothetical protein